MRVMQPKSRTETTPAKNKQVGFVHKNSKAIRYNRSLDPHANHGQLHSNSQHYHFTAALNYLIRTIDTAALFIRRNKRNKTETKLLVLVLLLLYNIRQDDIER